MTQPPGVGTLAARVEAAAPGGRFFVAALAAVVGVVAVTAPTRAAQSAPGAPAAQEAQAAQGAQDAKGAARRVSGRVVRPGATEMRPVPNVRVVLHRVGADTAGPLDSVVTGRDGSYSFRYRPIGSDDAIYFVSADYRGIAYFSPPLRGVEVRGENAEITVFDTTSGPLPLQVRGRHLVVSAPSDDGSREVIEVYELSNDSSLTLVSPDSSRPTWSALVPEAATDFRVGQGDISEQAVALRRGRVSVVAPFAPGVRQLSFAYRLPASSFPLSVPLDHAAGVFEVLVEDSLGAVSGARLVEESPVSVEGRTFKRYLARDAAVNTVARIAVPAAGARRTSSLQFAIAAVVIGAVMLIALAVSFRRRARPATALALSPGAAGPRAGSADELAREIAQLDREFDGRPDASPTERSAYEARRAELKRQLTRALDAARGPG